MNEGAKVMPPGTKFCVVCDLDGTLADLTHRREHLLSKPKNWKAFFGNMADDGKISEISFVYHALQNAGLSGVICSGRPDDHRAVTEEWLGRHMIEYERLYMRKAGDFRADDIVKRELLAQIRADGYEPHIVIDDRDRVVKMWRDEGLICLQAAPGDF